MHPKLFTRCGIDIQLRHWWCRGGWVWTLPVRAGQSVNKKVYSVSFVILFSMLEPSSLVCLQRDG